MLTAILIILAASVSLSALTVLVVFRMGKCPDAGGDRERDRSEYYDQEGNHLYYDRKPIARLKRDRATGKDK